MESDISEVCESDGTIMLCLILSGVLEVDVEVSVQITDETTTGIRHNNYECHCFSHINMCRFG